MELQLHSLLRRQLKRHVTENGEVPSALQSFVDAVNRAYQQFDEDRGMLERTLELSSNELLNANSELRAIFQALPDLFFRLSEDGKILSYKAGGSRDLYIPPEKLLGRRMQDFPIPKVAALFGEAIRQVVATKALTSFEYVLDLTGAKHYYEARLIPLHDDQIVAVIRNITEHKVMQNQLSQAQKMESIGQLAAGIAHEINTPTQYLGDNIRFLQGAFGDLCDVLAPHEPPLAGEAPAGMGVPAAPDGSGKSKAIDLDFYLEEVPLAIQQSLDGIASISKIVRSIKDFAHPDTAEKKVVDLNKAIMNTINVAHSEWKYVAEVRTDFDPGLPMVSCFPGDINQVVLNLIVNAAHAIADVVEEGSGARGVIRVSTRWNDPCVDIRIGDSGGGIPEEIRARIFDPFFTTKEVGRGTGQGLAIAHTVVVEKHGGTITFESEVGKGTTFTIRLPQTKG